MLCKPLLPASHSCCCIRWGTTRLLTGSCPAQLLLTLQYCPLDVDSHVSGQRLQVMVTRGYAACAEHASSNLSTQAHHNMST